MKFSIIMPVYNVQDYLDRSLKSIINQKYNNWECIIINDGSIDNSLEICQKYAQTDSRFKIYNQKNSGSGIARANGLLKASGEYICFVDPDDYLDEKALYNNVTLVDKYKPDVLSNGYFELKEDAEIIKTPKLEGYLKKNEFRNSYNLYSAIGATALWNKLYNRLFLINNNITFNDQRVGQDAVFNYKVYKYLNSIYVDSNSYYTYDMTREGSAVKTYKKERLNYELNISTSFKQMIKYWSMEAKYEKKLYLSDWNVLFHEMVNMNLNGSPLNYTEKRIKIKNVANLDIFSEMFNNIEIKDIPSGISKILFSLLKNKRYNSANLVMTLYMFNQR